MAALPINTSSALTMGVKSASVTIPKPYNIPSAKDGFGHIQAAAQAGKHQSMLPTPPNSISPNLPPHLQARDAAGNPPPIHLDSDMDLQDAPDHGNTWKQSQGGQPLTGQALSGLDSSGAITPDLLAKHHLPDVVLANGPIAIRNIMGYLTQTVPGFSRIPPAKARRLVGAALERAGGVNGDVEFEKVGWGRWDAHMKGQPPRDRGSRSPNHDALSPPDSLPSSYAISSRGMRETETPAPWTNAGRKNLLSGGSWGGFSGASDHDMGGMNMAEHEADKMSLDGDGDSTCSSSCDEAMAEAQDLDLEDLDEETENEDWAGMGAEALRKASLASNWKIRFTAGSGLSSTRIAKSAPPPRPGYNQHYSYQQYQRTVNTAQAAARPAMQQAYTTNTIPQSYNGVTMTQDAQEREAVEALLRMGSM